MRPTVLKLREDAIIPTKNKNDAGYDLYAVWDSPIVIHKPSQIIMFPTGIKMRFPHTHVALVKERGSTGIRNMQVRAGVVEGNFTGEYNVLLNNGNDFLKIIYVEDNWTWEDMLFALRENRFFPWTIEDDFEIVKDSLGREILSYLKSPFAYLYPQSKAIAQIVITNKEDWEFEEVNEDDFHSIDSDRGEGMLGSSGK